LREWIRPAARPRPKPAPEPEAAAPAADTPGLAPDAHVVAE